MKFPREVFNETLSKPSTWLKSSVLVGLAAGERGRSSFESSTARVMNVDKGMSMPNVVRMRCWTSRTALREMETATSVSGSRRPGPAGVGFAARGDSVDFGGLILTLLRSRWASLEMREDWSEEYEELIAPRKARTSPLRRWPLGPLAGILPASETGILFSRRSWATEG